MHERDWHLRASGPVLLHARFARSKDVTKHEVVDEREESELPLSVQWGGRQRGETLFEVAHAVGPRERPPHRQQRPRMAHEHRAGPLRDQGEGGAPTFGEIAVWHEDFTHERIVHEGHEIGLGSHVVVEGHRPGPQLRGNPAHRHGLESLRVSNREGRRGDCFAREARPPPPGLGAKPDR